MTNETEGSGAEPVTMDVRNQEVLHLTPPEVINHGFMKVLKRPVQWLIITALLVSWSAAGIVMFDFVTDEQLSNLQHMSADPVTAVNEAVEGFTDKMSSFKDIFHNAREYAPAVITDPVAAVNQWADASTSFLLGIHESEGVTSVLKPGGDVLDEMNGRIRSLVGYLFHMFEGLLDAVILGPLEMVAEAAANISDMVKVILRSFRATFEGVEVWIPKTSTSPMELASDVLEGAQNFKNNIVTHVSNLFSGDEGGGDLKFDPVKVVTDTVEELSDRRDMFLAYLSNILMEDKDDAPHVIRRKGEFLPPKEKVAELLGRKKDAAYLSLKRQLLKADFAKWNTKDVETTDVKVQRKASEADGGDVGLVESLDVVSDDDPAGTTEHVADVMDDQDTSGLEEEVIHQGTDLHEVDLGKDIEDTSDALGEVGMESILEMADEDPVETVSASLIDEEDENEQVDDHPTQTGDASSELVVEEKVNIDRVVDDEQPVESISIVDPKDQVNVDAGSEALGEEESVENVDVSDFIGEEEPVKLPKSAIKKTDEDQTFSDATINEESVKPTVSNAGRTFKPSRKKEPVETVSGGRFGEGPVKLPDTVTNENDEDRTEIKTGDTFSEATVQEESVLTNVEDFKPIASKNADEDQSETSVTSTESPFKMESFDVSFIVHEDKPINSTQFPTKDTDEEETKMDASTETVVQELSTTESSRDARDELKDKVEEKVTEEAIREVKEDQVEKAVKKDNGVDSENLDSKAHAVRAPFRIEDDVIQSDDENNNNNDRKRQPVKRDHVRPGATSKETDQREDERHEENEKVLEQERIAKEEKARQEVYKVIQEMRAVKAAEKAEKKLEKDKEREKKKEEPVKDKLKEKPKEDVSKKAEIKAVKVATEKVEALVIKKEAKAKEEKAKPARIQKEKAKPEPAPKQKAKPEPAPKEKAKPEPAAKEAEVSKDKAKPVPVKEPEVAIPVVYPSAKDIAMEVELLKAINQKLSILDLLRKDIGEIRTDLEVTQSQIDQLRMDNRTLKEPKEFKEKAKPAVMKKRPGPLKEKLKISTVVKGREALKNITKAAAVKKERVLKNITKGAFGKKEEQAPKEKVRLEHKKKEIPKKKITPVEKLPEKEKPTEMTSSEKKVKKDDTEVTKGPEPAEEEEVPYFQCFYVDEYDIQYPFFPFSPSFL
ncbi:hypothetical protein AMELA_G00119390 [Ameiurus melas]|uniref:Triadin n=1 Tax=Ameiurus melas TaxID=219545 RepID=A0A7J6ANM2_AMEME|nr:hypothetical protein AMELA_G00119390 [Ameiurus melas]